MKEFLHKIVLFSVTCLILVSGYHYGIYSLLLSDNRHYVIDKHITTIVLGDSHTETSVRSDPSINLLNLSFKGESIVINYYKLKRILEANSHIEHIILSFSYHSFSDFQDERLQLLLYDYYWLLDKEGLQLLSPTIENLDLVLKDMNGRLYQRITSIIKQSDYSLLNGGHRELEINNLNESSSMERIYLHYYNETNSDRQAISRSQKEYFDKIIKMSQNRKIKLTLINTPLHKTYYTKIPNNYITEYYSFIDNLLKTYPNTVSLLDLKTSVVADKYFHDGDHLNNEGSKYFMDILKNELQLTKSRITDNLN